MPNAPRRVKRYYSNAKRSSSGPPWLHVLSAVKTSYLLSWKVLRGKHPYGSTVKCTVCYGAIRPSMAPCAFCGQDIVPILLEGTPRKAPLWVDRKMHAVLWSHQAVHGSMCFLRSSHRACSPGRYSEAPLWVDRKMHAVLRSHQAVHGSVALSMVKTSYSLSSSSPQGKHRTPMGGP